MAAAAQRPFSAPSARRGNSAERQLTRVQTRARMPKSRGAVKKNKTKVVKQKKKKTKGRLLTTLLVRKADACACGGRLCVRAADVAVCAAGKGHACCARSILSGARVARHRCAPAIPWTPHVREIYVSKICLRRRHATHATHATHECTHERTHAPAAHRS